MFKRLTLFLGSFCLYVISAYIQYERIAELDNSFFQDNRIFIKQVWTVDECLILCSLNTDGCLSVSYTNDTGLNQQTCMGYSVVFQNDFNSIYIDDTAYYAYSKGACVNPYVTSASGTKCLWFSNTEKTWDDARDHCHQDGGRLMNVQNQIVNDDIANFTRLVPYLTASTTLSLFLGGFWSSDVWRWDGGNEPAFTYTNWKPNHPADSSTKSCLKITLQGDFHWRTADCTIPSFFICERDVI